MLKIVPITKELSDYHKVELLAKEAFPPEEYLPPDKLIEMSQKDGFDFFALYDEKLFVGFMTVVVNDKLAYLFFLAIDSNLRSKSYGSKALLTLREQYPDKTQIVDLEMLDDKAINLVQRKKRREFYLRNGYKPTGWFISYLGVDYEILCMQEFNIEQLKTLMSSLDIGGFNPRYFRM